MSSFTVSRFDKVLGLPIEKEAYKVPAQKNIEIEANGAEIHR